MGKRRNQRSWRLGTPSSDRETSRTRVDSPEGNTSLTNSNSNVQGNLGEPNFDNQPREPSQISDKIHKVWTQIFE